MICNYLQLLSRFERTNSFFRPYFPFNLIVQGSERCVINYIWVLRCMCDDFVLYVMRMVCVFCVCKNRDNNNFNTLCLSVYHLPIKMTALDFPTDVNAPDECCRNSGINTQFLYWFILKQLFRVHTKITWCKALFVSAQRVYWVRWFLNCWRKMKSTPDTNSNNIANIRYRNSIEICVFRRVEMF